MLLLSLQRHFRLGRQMISKTFGTSSAVLKSYTHDLLEGFSKGGKISLYRNTRNSKKSRKDSVPQQIRCQNGGKNFAPRPATTVFFQVLGNGATGGSRSLMLYTTDNRYLFNCGEGSHRLGMEHCTARAYTSISNIFLTSRTWKNVGGLLGSCLSIRSSGSHNISLHGPNGLMNLFESTKNFIGLLEFDVLGYTEDNQVFKDNNIQVEAVTIKLPQTQKKISANPVYSTWESASCKTEMDSSLRAYILTLKSLRIPKFDMTKCISMGIPPGSHIFQLKSGKNITLEDGTVFKAKSFFNYQSAGDPEVFIVIECPTLEYLPSILSHSKLQSSNAKLKNIKGIFHFTPAEIVNTDDYRHWMNQFPDSTQHIMINENSVGYGSKDILVYNQLLHQISPENFPNLLTVQKKELEVHQASGYGDVRGVVKQAQTGLRISVRPKIEEFQSIVEDFDAEQIVKDSCDMTLVKPAVNKVRERIKAEGASFSGIPEYPTITFLGTGSTNPSKYRGLSSILVETHADNFLILDCGEGTLTQLHRQFGRQRTLHILRNLRAIYVSHMHADHHMGMISLLQERGRALCETSQSVERLFVIGPLVVKQFLSNYHWNWEACLTNEYFIHSKYLLYNFWDRKNDDEELDPSTGHLTVKEIFEEIGVESIRTCQALHCGDAFCMSVTTKDGFKLVYTGDTRPTVSLVELGLQDKTPDILIHEGTMEQGMYNSCLIKKHSTFTEAIEEGKAMNAKNTIVTHFSQRYTKLPVLREFEGFSDVGIAFDGMTVNPVTVNYLSLIYPALRVTFSEELKQMESKTRSREISVDLLKELLA